MAILPIFLVRMSRYNHLPYFRVSIYDHLTYFFIQHRCLHTTILPTYLFARIIFYLGGFVATLSIKPSATTLSLASIHNLRSLFHWPPDFLTLLRKPNSASPIFIPTIDFALAAKYPRCWLPCRDFGLSSTTGDLGGHPLHVDILVAGRYHKHSSSIQKRNFL
jgi:hypothetical protein